jgi:uncharacterized membrane protein
MNGDLMRAARIHSAKKARSVTLMGRRWSMPAFCAVAYLVISLPVLVALCFFTGPFQVADESNHFFRGVQLSHGQTLPIVMPDRTSAGGYIDRSAKLWTGTLALKKAGPGPKRFTAAEVVNAPDQTARGPLAYAPFQNTVVYFPIAHAVPALAISAARHLNAPPVVWFYAGRLANALTALLVCALAIFLFEEGSLFALVICTLPMMLFEQASLSSDALVLAFSVLFAALLARIARGTSLKAWDYAALGLALVYVGVAKFAYLPLALAPPLVALVQKRDKAVVARLAGIGLFAVGLWAAWSFTIRNDVLSGRLDRADVDVHRQLAYVLHQPLSFVAALVRTVRIENIHSIDEMVGSRLGSLDLHMPKLLSCLSLVNLALVSVFRPAIPGMRPLSRLVIAVLALGSLAATLLLLYLQFNPVGQPWIDGFQGRYILPVLPLLPLAIGGWPSAARWTNRISLAAPLVSGVGAAATVLVIAQTYWR